MKKTTETSLLILGLVILVITTVVAIVCPDKTKTVLESLAIVTGLFFFIYKLITGWLFINLTVKVEAERESAEGDTDHIVFKVILSKGNIDSAWIKDIQIRVMQVETIDEVLEYNKLATIKPIGMKKRKESTDIELEIKNYWEREELDHYVLSPNEEATFSAFVSVAKNIIIAADILILGTRPFYSIGSEYIKRPNLIQWKSSLFILPYRTKAS